MGIQPLFVFLFLSLPLDHIWLKIVIKGKNENKLYVIQLEQMLGFSSSLTDKCPNIALSELVWPTDYRIGHQICRLPKIR